MILEAIIYLTFFILGFTTAYGSLHIFRRPARRAPHVHVVEMTQEEAHDIITEFLRSKARHPSQQHYRHPEMEDDE